MELSRVGSNWRLHCTLETPKLAPLFLSSFSTSFVRPTSGSFVAIEGSGCVASCNTTFSNFVFSVPRSNVITIRTRQLVLVSAVKRFSSHSVWHFLLRPSLEQNRSAWSHLSIKFAFVGASFPHIKAYVTPIFYPKHPSLIWIFESHTNLRYPLVNLCHCTTLSQLHNTQILPKFKTTCISEKKQARMCSND